jgi:hypothetical protein
VVVVLVVDDEVVLELVAVVVVDDVGVGAIVVVVVVVKHGLVGDEHSGRFLHAVAPKAAPTSRIHSIHAGRREGRIDIPTILAYGVHPPLIQLVTAM